MSNNSVTQRPVNINSYAFQFGIQSAQAGESCVPECIFVSRRQQIDFAAGFESVVGPTFATAQFTGSELPKPVIKERVSRTANATYARIVQATEKRQKRLEAMANLTVQLLGREYEGEVLFAV